MKKTCILIKSIVDTFFAVCSGKYLQLADPEGKKPFSI
jgi:hypothetical protein